MDNKIVKVWLWVFLLLSFPFWVIAFVGTSLYSIAYPFMIPYMLLKWKRVLTWDEYYQWQFKEE